MWRNYNPSDKNNYISRILDPFTIHICFPFSNRSTFDNSVTVFVWNPCLPTASMLILTLKINDTLKFRVFHPRSAPKNHEEFFAIWLHCDTAINTTVQKTIWLLVFSESYLESRIELGFEAPTPVNDVIHEVFYFDKIRHFTRILEIQEWSF